MKCLCLKILIFATICLLCLISCSDDINGHASLLLNITVPVEEKLLTVTIPREIKTFVYRATPLFEQDADMTGNIIGAKSEWTPVFFYTEEGEESTVGHLKASMGWYSSGAWEIEIKALNANGNTVYYGTTGRIYLNAGEINGYEIELRGVQFEGEYAELDISFTSLRTSVEVENGPQPKVELIYSNGETRQFSHWTSTNTSEEGTIRHTIHIDSLPAGEADVYIMLSLSDGSVITGERLAILLIGGEKSFIEGTLESGEYINPNFSITEDKSEIKGKITALRGVTEEISLSSFNRVFRAQLGQSATFSYLVDEGERECDTYCWLVDSIEKCQAKEFTFTPSDVGQYTVTAIAHRGEKTTSEEILVVFM